jgi:predicted Zn-dependent protease
MARGQAPAARDHFQAAIRRNPDFAEAHSNLGALEVKEGRIERSLPHFRAALAIDPGYAAARHNLARALDQLGRHEESLAEYLKLTSTERDDADAWAELAAVNLALGRRGPAGDAVAAALAIDGRHRTARRIAANLDRDAGKLEAALDAYQALARELPDDALVLVDQGIALVLAHRAPEALPGLRRAALLAGDNAAVRFALGVALAETGDDRAAAAELERAIALMQARGRDYPQARALLETLRKAP